MAIASRNYRTLYDVQQLLKEFNVFVYVGKRLYDIELMAIELDNLYQSGVVDNSTYTKAKNIVKNKRELKGVNCIKPYPGKESLWLRN